MSNKNTTPPRTRLNVEALEAREVPAVFGPTRGLSVAHGDIIPANFQDEYVTGTGPGRQALVRVWDNNGALLNQFNPFGTFRGGVFLAIGDVNDDNQNELIVSTAAGTNGRVNVYEFISGGLQLLTSFAPFGPIYSGGVQIAVGDVTGSLAGDRREEIIVGRSVGLPVVQVWSFDPAVSNVFLQRQFVAYGGGYRGGVTVTAGNIDTLNPALGPDDTDFDEIITGRASQLPQVRIWNARNPTVTLLASYFAFDVNVTANRRGIDVVAGSTDARRGVEIYVGLRNTGFIRFFSGETGAIIGTIRPFPPAFSRLVNFAISDRDENFSIFYFTSSLVVVAADGRFEQIPVVFDGRLFSPAGLNGSRPAA
jgi:hypothetical protein